MDAAIEECNEWLDRSTPEELEQPEWLAVAYRLANAYSEQLANGEADGNPSRIRAEVRRLLREVARHPGEFQDQARAAGALAGGTASKGVEVKGFAEAFDAGKAAIEQMGSAQLAAKLAVNNNPSAVSELEQQAKDHRQAALGYFESALKFAVEQAPQEDVVTARYYLCRLYWEEGRTDEAAALGLQIAQEHPDSAVAADAAQVTLAVYERRIRKPSQGMIRKNWMRQAHS